MLFRHVCSLTVCALLTVICSPAQNDATSSAAANLSPETRAAETQLIGTVMTDGQAYEYDRQLADTIGPRLTGSANYMRAAEWATEQFKQLGLSNVHQEDFTIPATWEPETAAMGRITAPVEHTLHIYSVGWSPSTPQGGVSGNVVYLKSFKLPEIDAQQAQLRGAIVFFDKDTIGEHPSFPEIIAGLEHLQALKPKALIFGSQSKNGAENATALSETGEIAPQPAAQIGAEDAMLIRRLLDKGPVRVEFSFTNRIREKVSVPQVIAEIPGRELPGQIVLLGAHMDSWHPGTGAQDNGTGVAGLLETARAVMALHRAPRRTMRFVLFGGEEEGLLGSNAYVRAHLGDLAKIDAVLISDTGAQPARGWYLMGRDDEKAALGQIDPLLMGLGGDKTSDDTEFLFQTDHAAFDMHGVPVLVLWTDVDKYFTLHHQASDTFDSVSEKDLSQGVAVLAATAYAIADATQEFAPHISDAAVQEMLKKTSHLEEYNFNKTHGTLP